MKISQQKLAIEAEATGFRPDVLEKVALLLTLLNGLQSHPFLKGKLALKGGTALNLFLFDVPRLSVDIDLNYIGSESLQEMLAERPGIEKAIMAVFSREGFSVRRMPAAHAGGKWSLRYETSPGHSGNLEVDINFMFRVPLWPVKSMDSYSVGSWRASGIPMMDIHELAAGKLAALLARTQTRDLFDSHRILCMEELEQQQLRIGFVVYGAMNRKDWRKVSVNDVNFEAEELRRQLIPTLRSDTAQEAHTKSGKYGERLVKECQERLSMVLPFTQNEMEFLDRLLENGIIEPELLTSDASLQRRIKNQPLLQWKAVNVSEYKAKG